ncbi:unnamed protein product [Toxocara canis]|uniref:LSDAT_euk domain-containing protein n=1 Tax=Toxocara canis TaxID=6265 RepID=A0A183UMF8_TOXCA|nr:unnamed protein product [Toxocara canis]
MDQSPQLSQQYEHAETGTGKFQQAARRIISASQLFSALRREQRVPLVDMSSGFQQSEHGNRVSAAFKVTPSLDGLLDDFIKRKLLDKTCQVFQLDPNRNSKQCFFCQKPRESHKRCELQESIANYEYEPAKIFGRLEFPGRYAKIASFVRFAFDDNENTKDAPNHVVDLLYEQWRVPKPALVLSIIGGYQDIRMSKEKQRKIVHESIMNVIDSTNGWLVTTGNDSGIAKVVAKAVAERQAMRLKNGDRRQIMCIGVAPWGNIEKRNEIEEAVRNSKEKVRQSVLNSNHTHFLLVDNGAHRENAEPAAVKFRAELEAELVRAGAPVITLLIEGSPTTVEQAFASVERGIPLIVLTGTGKVARLIGILRTDYANWENKEAFEKYASEKVRRYFFSRASQLEEVEQKWLNESVPKLLEICRSSKVTLVDANSRKDFDVAILQQFVAANGLKCGLTLAVQWNNIDAAREIVEKSDFEIEEQHAALITSITENKVDFVRLLVECGVDMNEFLSSRVLDNLYRGAERYIRQELKQLSKKVKSKSPAGANEQPLNLSAIDQILITFTNCPSRYGNDNTKQSFDDPFHELIIYAVFLGRCEMGIYFWEQTDRPLLSALVAVWLAHCLRKYFQKRFNETMAKSYAQIESLFEEKAIGLLEIARRHCPEWARDLVNSQGLPQWPHLSLIEIAAASRAQLFLGHAVCQWEIFRKWSRGYECNRIKYLLSFFLVVPMLFDFFVRFDKENVASRWHSKDPTVCGREASNARMSPVFGPHGIPRLRDSSSLAINSYNSRNSEIPILNTDIQEEDLEWYKKIYIFYTSACSKFTLHSISVQAINAGVDTATKASSCGDLQICSTNGKDLMTRFWTWFNTGSFGNWNNFDFAHFVIFIPTLAFRVLALKFPAAFPVARIGMIAILIIAYLRLFKIIFIMSYFGPKTRELLMFFMFFAVFMFAFSVSSQCLIHDNLAPYFGIAWDLFRHGLWGIFGETNEERMLGAIDGCANYSGFQWFSTPDAFDCFVRQHTLPILLTVYLFVTSVLLMNMLIAVFTHIFDQINERSVQLWRYQMYFLVQEYDAKFFLPAPLILFYHIFLTGRKLYQKVAQKGKVPKKEAKVDPYLINFERTCLSDYLELTENQKEEDSIEKIASKLDDLKKLLCPNDYLLARPHSEIRRRNANSFVMQSVVIPQSASVHGDIDFEDADDFVFDYDRTTVSSVMNSSNLLLNSSHKD